MTDWRDQLSDPPKPHTLPELMLLALDIAAEDAEAAAMDYEGSKPARVVFEELAGFDVYDKIREIVEPIARIPEDVEQLPGSILILEDERDDLVSVRSTLRRVADGPLDNDDYDRIMRMIEEIDRQLP